MTFDLSEISKEFGIAIKGLVHVGANDATELKSYIDAGILKLMLFEPLKEPFQRLTENAARYRNLASIEVFNVALGSEKGSVEINISTNDGASSSILEPAMDRKMQRKIGFIGKETVIVDLLSEYLPEEDQFNFLVIDVQGYELEVLRGAGSKLRQFDFIVSELNRKTQYKGSATVEEIDSFLLEVGYTRMLTHWPSRYWGDALYVKDEFISDNKKPEEIDFKKKRGILKRLYHNIIDCN